MKNQKSLFNHLLRKYRKTIRRKYRLEKLDINARRQLILEKRIVILFDKLSSLQFMLKKGAVPATVTIAAMAFDAKTQNFEGPVQNPFSFTPVTTAWGQVSTAFVDLDADGDFDMFTGETYGDFSYYENIGSSAVPVFGLEQINPFGITSIGNYLSRPTFADIDSDGDLDMMSGHYFGDMYYFENTGTNVSPVFGPVQTNVFGLVNVGFTAVDFTLVDIDNDGDYDVLGGEVFGNFFYVENIGTTSSPNYATAVLNPFNLTALPSGMNASCPDFVDLDSDGDLDLITGSDNGEFYYCDNVGDATNPSFGSQIQNPFGLSGVGNTQHNPEFVDIDGDGDYDLFSGVYLGGDLYFYEQTCPANSSSLVSCFGTDGEISSSPIGGITPYNYLWSTGEITQTITGLAAGSYSLSISSASCTVTESVTVSGPSATTMTSVKTAGQVVCSYDTDGVVSITVTGGDLPYNYSWNSGGTTTAQTGLGGGYHLYTVTDGCANTYSDSTLVNAPSDLLITMTSTQESSFCTGDGTATVNATGGSTPYAGYQWSNFGFSQTETGLVSGVYTVTMFDANLCTLPASVTITSAANQLLVSLTETQMATCGNNNGVVEANISGGVTPYIYSWNNGDSTSIVSNLVFTNSYSLLVLDSFGCSVTESITISGNFGMDSIIVQSIDESIDGYSDGSASVLSFGGTPPYIYDWGNAGVGDSISDLSPDTYILIVTDSNGCSLTDSVLVNQGAFNPCDTTNLYISANTNCFTEQTVAYPSGGEEPYMFLWSTGSINDTISIVGLWDDLVGLTVTDANNCSGSNSFTICWASIQELKDDISFILSPNPNNGIFSIMASEYGEYEIVIRNVVGQIVNPEMLIGVRKEIDLSFVNNGIYFVTIISDGFEKTEKIVVK